MAKTNKETIAFFKGDYRVKTTCGHALVHIPHDINVSDMQQILRRCRHDSKDGF